MLPPFDRDEIARVRALLAQEHHGPRLAAVLGQMPAEAAYALRCEQVDFGRRRLAWTDAGNQVGEVRFFVHIGQRLYGTLLLAAQHAAEEGRLVRGAPLFSQPKRLPPPPPW